MYEIELKFDIDHAEIKDKLASLNPTYIGEIRQKDIYFNAPHRDFAESDEALRVRREQSDGVTHLVTYKGPLVEAESKTRTEYETTIESADAMTNILTNLGFTQTETVKKDRRKYRYNDKYIYLDAVEELGEFIEIETEAEDIEPHRSDIQQLCTQLGLDPTEQIQTSYLGLLLRNNQ
ncbi:MAG: class IV adenylate cyclase [Halobacteriaceae archaeon]